jgi:DNA-binding HxlR family transcriptional regulator
VTTRRYGQACSIARALDVVGERWNLLIVRELMLGPRRFKDLQSMLPSMGTNRLTARLRELEAANVLSKNRLPPPADVPVYELTAFGEGLRPVLTALAAWGSALPPDESIDLATARPELYAMAIADTSDQSLTAGRHEAYQLEVDQAVFHVRVDDGHARVRTGPAPQPADLILVCGLRVFGALTRHTVSIHDAVRRGQLEVVGPVSTARLALQVLDARRLQVPMRLLPATPTPTPWGTAASQERHR